MSLKQFSHKIRITSPKQKIQVLARTDRILFLIGFTGRYLEDEICMKVNRFHA